MDGLVAKAFITVLVLFCLKASSYIIPDVEIKAIYPKGLKVTVRDDNFSLLIFHWNLNDKTESRKVGKWVWDTTYTKTNEGQWSFTDKNTPLRFRDKVYIFSYAIKDNVGYRRDNGEWIVTGYIDEDGNPATNTESSVVLPLTTRPDPETASSLYNNTSGFPCQLSVSQVSEPWKACKGQLLFEDNFETEIKKIWTPVIQFAGGPDYPFNVYMNDRDTLYVESGELIIKPITLESKYQEGILRESLDLNNTCTGKIDTAECNRVASGSLILPPIVTAKVTTLNKFSFKYGRIEVRARMPLGDWIVPIIQLEPRDNIYGSENYASGLLRIALVKGNSEYSKRLHGGPIVYDAPPFRNEFLKEKFNYDGWSNSYYNYTLVWKPDGITVYVDGENYGEINPEDGFYSIARSNNVSSAALWLKGTVMAPFDQMFYISLGVAVGGIHEFPDSPSKPWSDRTVKAMFTFWKARNQWLPTWHAERSALRVDYVRVYAL